MSKYNLKIHSLHFNCKTKFTLNIVISGENFPKPDSTEGLLNGNTVTFNFDSTSGETTNLASFEFSDVDILSAYEFQFENYPEGENDEIHGSINTKMDNVDDFFNIEDCQFIEEGNVVAARLSDEGGSGPEIKKGGILSVKKRPGVTKMYECVSTHLDSPNNCVVLEMKEADEDKLTGTIDNIPDSYFKNGLGISTIIESRNGGSNTISKVAMVN